MVKWVKVQGMSMSTDEKSPFQGGKLLKMKKKKLRKARKSKKGKKVSVIGTLKAARGLVPEKKMFKWY